MMERSIRLLVVAAESRNGNLLAETGTQRLVHPIDVSRCAIATARTTALGARFDAILVELGQAEDAGIDDVRRIVELAAGTPVIVVSSDSDAGLEAACLRAGAQEFVPVDGISGDALLRLVMGTIDRRSLRSELAETKAQLRLAGDQSRCLMTATADAVIVVDDDRTIRFANLAAQRMIGRPRDALIGTLFDMPFDGEGTTDVGLRTADGEEIALEMTVGRTVWGGRPAHLVNLRDITRRKIEEQLLISEKAEAEAMSRQKTAFLANMSHELRTPLNCILGFSDMIASEAFGPIGNAKYGEYIQAIHDSGHHLLSLINDLLDLSTAEAGQLELNPGLVDIAEVTAEVASAFQLRLISERLTFENGAEPIQLHADPRKLKQVMLNLVDNAIKFTPRGGTIGIHTSMTRTGALLIRVSDTGVGISAADLDKVFIPFQRSSDAYVREREGSGLGLPLSKHLVELHGGSIDIESVPGQGTVVTVVLPAKRIVSRRGVPMIHAAAS